MRSLVLGLLVCSAGLAPAAAGIDLWTIKPRTAADCAALVREHPTDLEAYRCYQAIVVVHGARDDARRGLDALLAIDPGNPRALLFRGELAREDGDARAEGWLRRAADGLHAARVHDGEVYARLGLATLHHESGHPEAVAADMERVDAANALAGDPALAVLVERAHGLAAAWRHEWGRAYRHYERARTMLATPEVAHGGSVLLRGGYLAGMVHDGFGSVAMALGRYREAIEQYQAYAALRAGARDAYHEALGHYNAALAATELARRGGLPGADAYAVALEAVDAAVRGRALETEGWARLLASCFVAGEAQGAEIARALEIARARRALALESWLMSARARNLAAQPDGLDAALEAADAALDAARRTRKTTEERHALSVRGDLLWQAGKRDEALAAWHAALDLVESDRARQDEDRFRAEVFGAQASLYGDIAARLLERHAAAGDPADLDEAFRVMERARARGLDEPSHDGSAIDLATLRAALPEDQAIVAFLFPRGPVFVGERRVERPGWAIVITRHASVAVPVAALAAVEDATALYLGLVARRDTGADRASARLYRELLAGPIAQLGPGIERLLVLADGPVHLLPLAALRPAADDPPLGTRFVLSTVPSAAFWRRWRARPDLPGDVLAFSDPPLGGALEAANALRAATLDGDLVLPALPNARREVRGLLAAVGARGLAVDGAAASERFLATTPLDRFSVLHFATHAVLDEGRPERSAILLASSGGGPGDGLLNVEEIERLRLDGKVVFLSACRSAAGRVLDGEGPMSLARAFFRAGARAVVGSLWPLRDDEQAQLAGAFATELARGATVADALSAAQRAASARGAPPAAWAGMVALGDAGVAPIAAVPGPTPWTNPRVLAAAALGALVLSAWFLHRRYGFSAKN